MLSITLAQLNPTVGGLTQNTDKIVAAIRDTASDIIVFPELMLSGYPPEDLLYRADFMQDVQACLQTIQAECRHTVAILGLPIKEQGASHLTNSAVVLSAGKVMAQHDKCLLPNYGVFDEKRYFTAGNGPICVTINGVKIGLAICEDLWEDLCEEHTPTVGSSVSQHYSHSSIDCPPVIPAKAGIQSLENGISILESLYMNLGMDLLISLNASPYCHGKSSLRKQLLSRRAKKISAPIVYVNAVGGQDELVFDGHSLLIDATGKVLAEMPSFKEACGTVVYDENSNILTPQRAFSTQCIQEDSPQQDEHDTYQALVLGVRDYAQKNGFKGALVGLSGGIDSALTLALAVDALGAEQVEAVLMPSRYTADLSNEEAVRQCECLGVKHYSMPIESPYAAFESLMQTQMNMTAGDLTSQNIQARCRGIILMAFSNQSGRLLLTTGNKSEMAMGYATLYGDMAGGFAPLKDVPKTWVYRLCRYRNRQSLAIPEKVIERPPSAELAPDQKDSDSLPPYDVLDAILEKYIECDWSPERIIALGYDENLVREVIQKVNRNEYKRRQSPPGIKITRRAFGRERRYPMTSAYEHNLR